MASLNRVILAGNLTRDPEGRRTASGTSVCNLGLAVNRRYRTGSGEYADETTFVDIEVWGQPADFCRDYLRKGAGVLIEGRLKLDTWDDRNTGQKRSKLRVVAERVQSLSGREGGASQGGYSQQQDDYAQAPQQQYASAPQQPSQQGNWGQPQQAAPRPAPPPFPAQDAPAQQQQPQPQGNVPSNDAFDVSDESIDDIPF